MTEKQPRRAVREEVATLVAKLDSANGQPGLAVVLVGSDPASEVYVRMKGKACEKAGIRSLTVKLPATTAEAELLAEVEQLNNDPDYHGILVQLPLPAHMNSQKVIEAINPLKDVDCFHPFNVGRLVIGIQVFEPATPAGIMELLRRYQISASGKHVVVVGRSNIVGKPMANLLVQKNKDANALVTVIHSAAADLGEYTRQADILIAAIGRPEMITANMVKEGAIVIDVGVNRVDADTPKGYRLVGDVHFDGVAEKASYITPVPGGVGPMTIAMLLKNTLRAYQLQQQ